MLAGIDADGGWAMQIQKKRHIGNDIVVLVYKEGKTPFSPDIIKSCFNRMQLAGARCTVIGAI
jgi:hypothetical protein